MCVRIWNRKGIAEEDWLYQLAVLLGMQEMVPWCGSFVVTIAVSAESGSKYNIVITLGVIHLHLSSITARRLRTALIDLRSHQAP